MSDKSYAGLDLGSTFSKVVILRNGEILAYDILPSGGNYLVTGEKLMKVVLEKIGAPVEDISEVVATGLGAPSLLFANSRVSDISCQGKGINYLFPSARTIIEIGGQSSRVANINSEGMLLDFAISEKCATGSGRFLQIIARVLGVDIKDIGTLALTSQHPVEFSTGCAVFAESEAVSRVAEGATKEDILAGVHKAIAMKVVNLVKRIHLEKDCVFTGGGAKDIALVDWIGKLLSIDILVPDEPRITAALGAACFALEQG